MQCTATAKTGARCRLTDAMLADPTEAAQLRAHSVCPFHTRLQQQPFVQAARSGRSKCRQCQLVIEEGALRVGVRSVDQSVLAQRGYAGLVTHWHHLDCYAAKLHSTGGTLPLTSTQLTQHAAALTAAFARASDCANLEP